MTKWFDEDIEVVPDPRAPGAARAFVWRGRRYVIDQNLGTWQEAGEWWNGAGAHDRAYVRVLARPAGLTSTGDVDADGFLRSAGAVYDVYYDRRRAVWKLARLWD